MEDLLNVIPTGVNTALIIVVAALLAYQRWKTGSKGIKDEIIKDYETRIHQLEEQIKAIGETITKQTEEINGFKIALQEKDKHIDLLTKLLEGRNPELITLLTEIKELAKDLQKFMRIIYQEIGKSKKELQDELNYQTGILEAPSDVPTKKHKTK